MLRESSERESSLRWARTSSLLFGTPGIGMFEEVFFSGGIVMNNTVKSEMKLLKNESSCKEVHFDTTKKPAIRTIYDRFKLFYNR